jgi:transcriptional regulator with XRE-family HTH domain
MKFNENLKYLRKEAGLTQEQLAEQLNVSRQAVTKWESGQSLPDIENLKEISMIFSVTIDSLVGEIESKSTLRIKKKINDIGWFIFGGATLLIFYLIIPIYDFISQISENEEVNIFVLIGISIIAFILLIICIKKYLGNYKQEIINMKDTEEGRKERKYVYMKKYTYSLSTWIVLSIISNLGYLPLEGIIGYIKGLVETILIGAILDVIITILLYIKGEKKIKKLNED